MNSCTDNLDEAYQSNCVNHEAYQSNCVNQCPGRNFLFRLSPIEGNLELQFFKQLISISLKFE
jgi:hypothetical protein